MGVLALVKSILMPQSQLAQSDFLAATPKRLMSLVATTNLTYYAVAGLVFVGIAKFRPKTWLYIASQNELRKMLHFATPWPLVKSVVEIGIDLAITKVAYDRMPSLQSTFPSAVHAFVACRSIWPCVIHSLLSVPTFGLLSNSLTKDVVLPNSYVFGELVSKHAAADLVFVAGLPGAHELMNLATAVYRGFVAGGEPCPAKRAILRDLSNVLTRVATAAALGAVVPKLPPKAWLRILVVCAITCVDAIGFQAFLQPKLLDKVAPYALGPDDDNFVWTEETANSPEALRLATAFETNQERRDARTMLGGLDAQQMQFVQQFCWELTCAEHVRWSVKTEAMRLFRYAGILHDGTRRDAGIETADMERVASMYEADDDTLEAHQADEEHRTCVICMSDFADGEAILSLKTCRHSFHSECGKEWLKKSAKCPLCNSELYRQGSASGDAVGAGGAEEDAQEGRTDLFRRVYRLISRARCAEPEAEFGPLYATFWSIGREKGMSAVRALMAFDPAHQQSSAWDFVWVIVVYFTFPQPFWTQ